MALDRPFLGASGIKQGILAQMKRDGLDSSVNNFFLLGIPINYPQITLNTTASTPAHIITTVFTACTALPIWVTQPKGTLIIFQASLVIKIFPYFWFCKLHWSKAEACLDLTPFCKHAD